MKKRIAPSLWLKSKGYRHLTNKLNVSKHGRFFISRITNEDYVKRHSFFPLLHSVIYEPRYKKIDFSGNRSHKKVNKKTGRYERIGKPRPLHYATHVDSLIFSYYGQLLYEEYKNKLDLDKNLSDSIIAYRKIPDPDNPPKNKGTIHFAKEAFLEISQRTYQEETVVLKFDIQSFFNSINHDFLLNQWKKILEIKDDEKLPEDHYKVYKAVTTFSYVQLEDFKLATDRTKSKVSFDEKKLAECRKKGVLAFFQTPKEFRDYLKAKKIRLYRYPFRDKITNIPIGIPQGLPISSVLANIYLYDFDIKVVDYVVHKLKGYYRRYSDDMIVVVKKEYLDDIYNFMTKEIKNSKVIMSEEKTEKFLFKKVNHPKLGETIKSFQILETTVKENIPLTFLGFEFYGYQTLIKSGNLAKFYRRMISAVKIKSKHAKKFAERNPDEPLFIRKRQLYKLYTQYDLRKTKSRRRYAFLRENERGYFEYTHKKNKDIPSSNYLTYVTRASMLMNEPKIKNQLRNHIRIFKEAVRKHLNK
ncbi:hypothetical protein KACHI17_10270 [Sediminibacterium sp. KACHI17]|uniref:Reverse transcriptase domain-containing protein n=1 Tax=Sediminibacterium sp. KACHI17 TaxID=1751071 RepID=A0AAT9GHP6_9BACT